MYPYASMIFYFGIRDQKQCRIGVTQGEYSVPSNFVYVVPHSSLQSLVAVFFAALRMETQWHHHVCRALTD
jgi:hypothetical protein